MSVYRIYLSFEVDMNSSSDLLDYCNALGLLHRNNIETTVDDVVDTK